jgi:disulfide bond formation protein DsbB
VLVELFFNGIAAAWAMQKSVVKIIGTIIALTQILLAIYHYLALLATIPFNFAY